MQRCRCGFYAILLVFVAAASSSAQKPENKAPEKAESSSAVDGAVTIAGQKVEYKAATGTLPVTDLTGKAKAKIFYTSYTRTMEAEPSSRPLTFCFNGGPGSASLWVHLGLFGPRRVLINEDGTSLPLPAQLVENEWSLLDLTDLVFIDPVSTGFSRSDDPKEAKLFHGLEEDTHSVGEFIRAYIVKNGRLKSPIYVAGESYGTTRAASLANFFQPKGPAKGGFKGGGKGAGKDAAKDQAKGEPMKEEPKKEEPKVAIHLVGIILISTVLDFETIRFGTGNEMPYPFFLPTYAAAAFHHKKIDRGGNLLPILDEAEQFAGGPYLAALRKGNLLGDEERKSVAKTMARYTGLSEEFIVRSDLRVEAGKFRSELLRDSGEVIGRYDSRVKAKPKGNAKGGKGGGGNADPSMALLQNPFGDSIKNYLTKDLQYETDLKYNTSVQMQGWNYGKEGTNRYPSVAARLRAALEKDRKLRVFVASGYSDLATPFYATKYTFAHIGPRALMDRITLAYYPSGHMIYTHQPSLRKLGEDLHKFMKTEGDQIRVD
jgi:carboxypeptidase C (cathepsin A)